MTSLLASLAILTIFLKETRTLLRSTKFRSLLIWVVLILLAGTIFYRNVEGWSWLDAAYFSVVTLATVGYGDLSPTTPAGKVFAMLYILIGLGVIATFANMLARERIAILEQRLENRQENES